jgi:hypothetical protein
MAECPHCEYNKKRAQNWRVEAYRLAGYQLPTTEPVKVSALEFVTMVLEKEHLVGRPIIWAQWPTEEKNT